MKRFFSFFLVLASFANLRAQEITHIEPSFSDFIPILKSAGYEVFSFDISSLKDDTYQISYVIREYSFGELVKDSMESGYAFPISNRTMISAFSEDIQKDILESGDCYDLEKGIFSLGEKLSIGFTPASDSLKRVSMTIVNQGIIGSTLSLKPLNAPGYNKRYSYDIRPFKLDAINVGGFTPLLLVGSFWYDETHKIVRFCGETEFPTDMSSETFSRIPHYYVIGVYVKRQ